MKENLDKNTTIKEVVERYLKQENMSIYKLSKESKLSVKTIKKMLKNTSSNFNKKTLEKLCILKKLNSDDKKDIKLFFKDKKSKKENDIEKINSFKSDFETTTKIIPFMWKLNDEVAKLFSELELLLEINNQEENRKMKIGLNKIADNLIDIGTKLKKYGENNKNEEQIIDMEVK